MQHLKIYRFKKDAVFPEKKTEGSVGYDIYAYDDAIIPARGQVSVSTKLAVIPPIGYYTTIESRSGLAFSAGIEKGAGLIDTDYRNEVKILLFNHSDNDYKITGKKDRIAQLVVRKKYDVDIVETTDENDLIQTTRTGGFGSTGK
jgi:dUTP pyrophosphatase